MTGFHGSTPKAEQTNNGYHPTGSNQREICFRGNREPLTTRVCLNLKVDCVAASPQTSQTRYIRTFLERQIGQSTQPDSKSQLRISTVTSILDDRQPYRPTLVALARIHRPLDQATLRRAPILELLQRTRHGHGIVRARHAIVALIAACGHLDAAVRRVDLVHLGAAGGAEVLTLLVAHGVEVVDGVLDVRGRGLAARVGAGGLAVVFALGAVERRGGAAVAHGGWSAGAGGEAGQCEGVCREEGCEEGECCGGGRHFGRLRDEFRGEQALQLVLERSVLCGEAD